MARGACRLKGVTNVLFIEIGQKLGAKSPKVRTSPEVKINRHISIFSVRNLRF